MEVGEIYIEGLGRINGILHRSLEGASGEMLCRMPAPHSNSMAWTAWHLTRVHDDHMADLAAVPQLWTSEGWHDSFSMPPDDAETGQGHSFEEVAAFKVASADLLLGYADAALERSKKYLAGLGPADLDRELDEPQYDPLPTLGVRLVSIIADNTQHAGQVAYLRGFFEEKRWGRA
ncbi:MAG: DUF664 domain-containing protein [Nitrospinaceae bacterium]|nr:DUF664 domain-containing protein [Nitrospinaceae bacterium]MBT3434952.1 DUF664 domain-containing protein [Nitrospinaceae bacterium]MBT3819773.1 DUF664 domain-containing protein [Nitrospinaceae bacterium]MBT4094296.1 DUF664 domain-containing protein [Nitrospinaceae bacterium]MBT4432376.1 DUF664 domain-containing protein [Nitrospinaceae bacterium]